MEQRYTRNIPSLSEQQQKVIGTKHVLVAGCGGIGGYVAEYLARLGIGKLTLADSDTFEKTNLNRQLYATEENIGKSKVVEIKERLQKVNPLVEADVWMSRLRESTAETALKGKDLVIDCLDSVADRLMLENVCGEAGLTLIHGALTGVQFQVMTVTPGSGSLRKFYDNNVCSPSKSTLSFVPGACAAVQVSEALKVLCGEEPALKDRMMVMDLKTVAMNISDPGERIFADREISIRIRKYNVTSEYSIPQFATIRELLKAVEMEGENLFVLRNGAYVMPDTFDDPILEEGDLIEFRKSAAFGG
ncbi:MAG: HesA/MoeB/ThiF family protein [Anaerovoracaceae bacterium]